jgi:translation initiation factor 2 beta subunit (eIF-2beta)/eIF-5
MWFKTRSMLKVDQWCKRNIERNERGIINASKALMFIVNTKDYLYFYLMCVSHATCDLWYKQILAIAKMFSSELNNNDITCFITKYSICWTCHEYEDSSFNILKESAITSRATGGPGRLGDFLFVNVFVLCLLFFPEQWSNTLKLDYVT